jgi:hypothetical protein
MHVLQELLGPMPVREFFRNNFTRLPFAMPDQATLYTQDLSDAVFAAIDAAILRQWRRGFGREHELPPHLALQVTAEVHANL